MGLAILVVVAIVVGATSQLPAFFGFEQSSQVLTHQVNRGDLVITVIEDGNLESISNRDIKCELEGGGTILWIVEDGRQVKQGEVLVELDASNLQDQLTQQKMAVEKARAVKVQAEQDFEVAKIAIQEYLEGTYQQQIQDIEAQITIAMENLRSAENALEYTHRMLRKGYATPLQLEAQKFAVERAKLDLASAETAKTVLEKFTKVKTLKGLEAQRDAAEAKMLAERAAFDTEANRLKRLDEQLKKCVIHAPQGGMVIYANSRSRWGSERSLIEEGTAVRERQTIIQLPDLSRMQVKVLVHESKVDRLRRGMRARIRVQDQELQGTVTSIANQPEPTGWMSANVKEYATIVQVDSEPRGLKPGMTAEVKILVSHMKDVLSIPVQAVVEQGGDFLSWVQTPVGGPERRPVVIGASNDTYIEIKDGLVEGDAVLLNPRAVVPEARQNLTQTEPLDVAQVFGESEVEMEQEAGGGGSIPVQVPVDAMLSSTDGPGDAGPEGPGSFRSRQAGQRGRSWDPMQYDQDGDGKVSREEAPEFVQGFFDRIDGNGDGFIDASEISEMRSRFRERGVRDGRPEGGSRGFRGDGGESR